MLHSAVPTTLSPKNEMVHKTPLVADNIQNPPTFVQIEDATRKTDPQKGRPAKPRVCWRLPWALHDPEPDHRKGETQRNNRRINGRLADWVREASTANLRRSTPRTNRASRPPTPARASGKKQENNTSTATESQRERAGGTHVRKRRKR